MTDTERRFYVYAVSVGGRVIYIGKGCGDRLKVHLTRSHNPKVMAAVAEARESGVPVVVRRIAANLAEPEAYAIERRWIQKYKERLANASAVRMSPDERALHQFRAIRARIRPEAQVTSEQGIWWNRWLRAELDRTISELAAYG